MENYPDISLIPLMNFLSKLGFTPYLVEVQYQSGVAVLFVHLAVEEDDLPLGDDYVELLPAVAADVLLARGLQPPLQTSLRVAQLSLRS